MKKYYTRFSITLVIILVSIVLVLFLTPAPPLLSGLSYSKAVFDQNHRLLRLTLSEDGKYRLLTPLADAAPLAISATLLQEDQYFYWHTGLNPVSLLKATWQTYFSGKRRVGASTISMQVARMRYGIYSKNFAGKARQIWMALRLEAHYSKTQLLEAYLNLAPYGNNVEGIGAASLIYFGKTASALNLPEALTLAVIPQNPTKRSPDHVELKDIRNKLYTRWVAKYPEDKNKLALMNLPLQIRKIQSVPFLAPHFVNEVLTRNAFNSSQTITTLDLNLQQMIEHATRAYLVRRGNVGVNNAAILLIDTSDMGIKAEVGSANFFKKEIGGQINGTQIKRSPGSTLKPFIYALALDQGLIHPATVLKDVPHSFGSYNPENFDYDFMGPIKAKDALILSRNIPAVYLADQLKHPSLYEFLQQAQIQDLKSEQYYGLSLVLGGAELTMHELVELYASLTNNGFWKPLNYTNSAIPSKSLRLLSPEASYLVLDMLKDTQQPGVHYGVQQSQTYVSWKTGTSSGYRDAWTIGVFGPYVMAVWIGNFNNQSNPALIGKEMAAPLFFEIVRSMQKKSISMPIYAKQPAEMNLSKVEVCKASGMLPTRYCRDTEMVWFIPGKSPIKTDTVYREVAINEKTGLRTCHFDRHTRFDVYEFWPSDVLKIFKRAGVQRRIPPAYEKNCQMNNDRGFAPQIASPQTQLNYITRLEGEQGVIPFTAVVDADVHTLHWFLNENYLGKTTRDQSFMWRAKPGHYTVRVVDDFGRADAREIDIKLG
ncbi:MAG: penicillin-binding protein 1C [Gammaproteobacteria bacterium]